MSQTERSLELAFLPARAPLDGFFCRIAASLFVIVAVIVQGEPLFGGGKNASLIETPVASQAVDSEVVNKEVYLLFPSQKAETALPEKKN